MRRLPFLRAALLVFAAGALPAAARAEEKAPVTVFAAASLREAFDAAGAEFTRRSRYPVRFDFGGSDALATQIAQGAPADVFASANERQFSRVASLLDAQHVLARNRLVTIAAVRGPVQTLADLAKPGVRVVLAAPAVPVGAYARAAIRALAGERAYGSGFEARVAANVVSEETDVKAVATKVSLGEADAGIVYATDVTPAIAPSVRVVRFPPGVAPEAVYPIAALKRPVNAEGARAFLEFITSPAGLAFLKARGFQE